MKKLLMTAVIAVLTATGGKAADLAARPYTKAPPMVGDVVDSWTGFYIGVNGGGAWGRTSPDLSVNPNGYFIAGNVPAVEGAGRQGFDNSGGLAGGQIGYLWQSGRFIGGIEAGFDWMRANGSVTSANVLYPVQGCVQAAGCAFTLTNSTSTNWLFTLLGRAGFDAGGWFPYVTGGLAVADARYSVAFIDNNLESNVSTAGSFSKTAVGFAVGGGAEWKLSSNWSVRGEYLYVDLGSIDGTTPKLTSLLPGFPGLTNYVVSAHLRENIARVAFSYRFGG